LSLFSVGATSFDDDGSESTSVKPEDATAFTDEDLAPSLASEK